MTKKTGDMIDCTILILTYKGKKHLEFLLPTVRASIQNTPEFKIEVLIVDNGCDEPTKKFVENYFPEFHFEFSTKNDYLFSLNVFVQEFSSPYVFILNDDMKLDADVLNETLPIIQEDEELFAVGTAILDWEGEMHTVGVREMTYHKAWLESHFVPFQDESIRYTLYGGGGAAVFRTSYFNELSGFNDLYRPAYAEDLDLGHRAWHRGWPSVINPKAVLYHREGGTIHEQFTSDVLEQKIRKNQFLWMWRNGKKAGFLVLFFLMLPLRMFKWRKTNHNLYLALRMALPDFPKALKQRLSDSKPRLSDTQIMKKLNKIYEIRK